jgi:hypothetical protein
MSGKRREDTLLHLMIPALSAPAASATASRFWHTWSYPELTVSARASSKGTHSLCLDSSGDDRAVRERGADAAGQVHDVGGRGDFNRLRCGGMSGRETMPREDRKLQRGTFAATNAFCVWMYSYGASEVDMAVEQEQANSRHVTQMRCIWRATCV